MSGVSEAANSIAEIVSESPPDVNTDDNGKNTLARLQKLREMLSARQMGFLYNRWRQNSFARGGWDQEPFGNKNEDNEQLAQLETLNWGLLWGLRGRAANMAKTGEQIGNGFRQAKSALGAVWEGDAADAAFTKFDDVLSGAGTYTDTNTRLAGALQGYWQATRPPVRDLGEFGSGAQRGGKFVDIYKNEDDSARAGRSSIIDKFEQIAGMGFANLQACIKYAAWYGSASADGLFEPTGAPVPMNLGSSLRDARIFRVGSPLDFPIGPRFETFPEGLQFLSELVNEVAWLDDLCQQYNDTVKEFRDRIRTAYQTVEDAAQKLSGELDGLRYGTSESNRADPFAKLKPPEPKEEKAPRDERPRQNQQPADTGSPQQSTGGQPQSTGAQPAATGPTPSPAATPAAGMDPTAAARQAGIDPASGQPMWPDQPGVTPATGQPIDGAPAGQPQSEKMTIEDGGRKITMESPVGAETMTLTFDDGTGAPQTYEMDFGTESPATATGSPGVDHAAGAQPPAEPPDGPAGQGQAGQGQVDQGQTGPAVAAVRHAQAGPDGKVVFDGPMTVTGERTPDGVKITLDDGAGSPKTYTLSGDPESAGTPGGQGQHPDAGTPGGQGSHPDAAQPAGGSSQTTTPQAVGFEQGGESAKGFTPAGHAPAGASLGDAGGPHVGTVPSGTGGTQHGQPSGAGLGDPGSQPAHGPGDPGVADDAAGGQPDTPGQRGPDAVGGADDGAPSLWRAIGDVLDDMGDEAGQADRDWQNGSQQGR
ncbi:MAG: hypothetical protein GEU98_13950 [Pseudonocardiaceae bacterium]|nr:hypothetical protein [Pseudonocardiaceae bacterium]